MRILIVEDEPVHARYLTGLLREAAGSRIQAVRTQKSLAGAELHLEEHGTDLVFLDLNLYGQDGFELLRTLNALQTAVVVVTAHPNRAIEGFAHGVLDFLAKPVTADRLRQTLLRYDESKGRKAAADFFSADDDGSVRAWPAEEILYFEARDKHLLVHLVDGSAIRLRHKIGEAEKDMSSTFVRVHRSYLVNADFLRGAVTRSGGRCHVELAGGRQLPASRRLLPAIQARLKGAAGVTSMQKASG